MSDTRIQLIEAVGRLSLGTLAMLFVGFVIWDSIQITREIRSEQLVLQKQANELRLEQKEVTDAFTKALEIMAQNQTALLEKIHSELERERIRDEVTR